ncbi:hypothetical protein DO021_22175 [Desulfobacter hydrogenophilus]|uniref:Uncharacterized protein n=1 Tax=Desulfobacter hydrogenophilus TaxID=2291 RepID=A0A328F694_9BACT|nr:hypothetical protein [Desulfobacter hydrogenophilus]NDY74570.1 hypothetical protein [Desulfobacter hydrogenophilus]QBH15745.1 hypothetical protein EYB58_22995 [Desulfobacter hydrogenophilus]RAL99868.1 hypothetical protein DO021_22175 [Desulfobacter hydrogenophilus]
MTEIKTKLEKLARLEAGNRERVKRYLNRVKKDGKKQISAIVSANAYNELNRLRDASIQAGKPSSFGQIIELALACYADSLRSKSG